MAGYSNLVPRDGAFTYAGLVWDFQTQSLVGSQVTDNVTPYGSAIYSARNIGSGTPSFTANITGFAKQGANTAAPQFVGSSTTVASGSLYNSNGVNTVCQFDNNCTESFTGVLEQQSISQSRIRGATAAALRLISNSEITEAWIIS